MKKIALIAVMLLAGCAQRSWAKPGATMQEFERDKSYCMAEGSQAAGGDPLVGFLSGQMDMCMRGRGWTMKDGQ